MIYLWIDLLFMGTLLARVLDFYRNFTNIAVIKGIILNDVTYLFTHGFIDMIWRK